MNKDRLLVLGILLTYASLFHPEPGWNVASRLGLIYSVVDHGSLSIDPYHETTGDKAFHRGHFYSDKAVGHAVVGVPVYAAVRLVLRPFGVGPGSAFYHYFLKTLLVSLPSAVGCLVLLHLARQHLDSHVWSRRLVAAYALGTLAFPYSVVYYAHQQVAVVLLGAFALARGRVSWTRSLAVGLLVGYGFLLEYPTALAGAPIIAYHVWQNRRAASVLAVVGGVLPTLVIFGAYNWACFGSPLSTGYSHKYLPHLAHVHSAGFLGIARPSPAKLAAILLAPKGILATSPFLLLALPGLITGRKNVSSWAALAVGAVLLVFNASVIWEPFGGWTPGPRYSIPAVAFLALLCSSSLRKRGPWRALLVVGGLTGLLYHGLAATADVHVPEEVGTPFTQYLVPLALRSCFAGATAWTLLGAGAGLCVVGVAIAGSDPARDQRASRQRRAAWILAVLMIVVCWACLVRPVNAAWGHYHAGSALLQCGRVEDGEAYLVRSLREDPELQPAHTRLGLHYAAQGRVDDARRHLQQALALRGSDDVARRALQSLRSLE
jgi:hypothetical protein